MKVTKKSEHALLVKPFGANGRLYLACSILIYFDLADPASLLREKDLWEQLPEQIGSSVVLDMGMPKPRGEVVVTGKCFAPRGTSRPASEISLQVGTLRKRLNVFGNRYWKQAGGVMVMTDPEPFKEMPVTWQNAFGGESFDKNPLGKGIDPVQLPDGQTVVPLPTIENPEKLIGSASDRPDPAGIAPIDVMWPQRFSKQGTYDEKWKRERWPHFPDDMNYEFFNTAPQDQFIDAFFNGDETITVMNMHPDVQLIQSRLPGRRIRCFATKKKDLKSISANDDLFEEVKTRIDTVWLFPGILKGLAVYRGTTEILDDEYADVRRIFLATEDMTEAPQSIEHYLEEQKKALDTKVPVNTAPLEDARAKIAAAMKRVKSIPKDIEAARLRATGKRPVMKRSPEEMAARSGEVVRSSLAVMDGIEKLATGLQARHGHRVNIDLKTFDGLREKFKNMASRLEQGLAGIQQAKNEGTRIEAETSQVLKQYVSPEALKKAGIDPDQLLPKTSVNPWHDHGFPLVLQWRRNLEQNPAAKKALEASGFSRQTLKSAWFGINPKELLEDRNLWGLAENEAMQTAMVIPAGLTMPRFTGATLNRIAIRPGDYTDPAQDVVVAGSDESPLFLPSAEGNGAPVIRVADELDAWYMEQETGDACSVVALESQGEKPTPEALDAMKNALAFLIVVPETADKQAEESAWVGVYSNAKVMALPKGKTVLEAYQQGVDIRSWIMKALPEAYARRHRIEIEIPEQGCSPSGNPTVPFPKIDVGGILKQVQNGMKAHTGPVRDEALATRKELEGLARQEMAKHGLDSEKVLGQAERPAENPAEAAMSFKAIIAGERERIRATGHLTSDMESRMNAAEDLAAKTGQRASELYRQGMAHLEKAGKLRQGHLPEWAKKIYERHGIDPDDTDPLTRERVIEDYEKGKSFAGKNLSGLDLSGLDLRGIDLRKCRCLKTDFSKTILEAADFSEVLAEETNFTKASMARICAKKAIFKKTAFKEADLTGAKLDTVSLQEADLRKASLSNATLKKVTFQKSDLGETAFASATAAMCLFLESNAMGTDFKTADLTKCLFRKTGLDQADFSGAVLNATMFYAAGGASVAFAGADLSKSRMGGQSRFPGADFKGIQMNQGCFRDSDLSGADFKDARIESAMLENCDLSGAKFPGVACTKTRLAKSNLEAADMRGANLFLGSLRKTRLVNADLRNSNLFGVDVYKAELGGTRLEGANLKRTLLEGRTDYLP